MIILTKFWIEDQSLDNNLCLLRNVFSSVNSYFLVFLVELEVASGLKKPIQILCAVAIVTAINAGS